MINYNMYNNLTVFADPEKRNYGAFGYIGLLVLLGSNVILALKLLGVMSA